MRLADLHLPVERRGLSATPRGSRRPVVYRYETEQAADHHLVVEREVLSSVRVTR